MICFSLGAIVGGVIAVTLMSCFTISGRDDNNDR